MDLKRRIAAQKALATRQHNNLLEYEREIRDTENEIAELQEILADLRVQANLARARHEGHDRTAAELERLLAAEQGEDDGE